MVDDRGHIGMILKETEYTMFWTGATSFIVPKKTGPIQPLLKYQRSGPLAKTHRMNKTHHQIRDLLPLSSTCCGTTAQQIEGSLSQLRNGHCAP
jgi:hypothetical protein